MKQKVYKFLVKNFKELRRLKIVQKRSQKNHIFGRGLTVY